MNSIRQKFTVLNLVIIFLCSGLIHLGGFRNDGTPLEFLSTFLLRASPLEMRRERWETFPEEAGIGTLIRS